MIAQALGVCTPYAINLPTPTNVTRANLPRGGSAHPDRIFFGDTDRADRVRQPSPEEEGMAVGVAKKMRPGMRTPTTPNGPDRKGSEGDAFFSKKSRK